MKNTPFIRHLIKAFEFIKENWPYYYFYLNVSLVQFFTFNILGLWLYFLAVIFLFQDSGFSLPLSSFFIPRNIVVRVVLVASLSLAIIKGIPSAREFMGKRLEKGVLDNLVKDSSFQLIINSFKPFFLAALLHWVIFLTELSQRRAYSEKLLHFYGKVSVQIDPLGLKRALLEVQLFLRDESIRPYFFSFLLFILVVIILLHWLEEKEKKLIKDDIKKDC